MRNLYKTPDFRNRIGSLALALLLSTADLQAAPYPTRLSAPECDLCGCTTNGGNLGYGTLGNTNFFGVRYVYQNFESRDGIFEDSPIIKESFNTYQLWAKIPVHEKISITGVVPYQDLYRNFEDRTEHLNGIGDISFLGWYTFPFTKKQLQEDRPSYYVSLPTFTGHSLGLGAGLKLPTGKFEEVLTERVNPGFQLGTGSVDGIFSIAYSYTKNNFGLNATGSYYLKGENKNQYKFGNQFSYTLNLYKHFAAGTSTLSPSLALSGDVYQKIEQFGDPLPNTDGRLLIGSAGGEIRFKRFVAGVQYGIPLSQNLFGGEVTMKHRLLFYGNYTL